MMTFSNKNHVWVLFSLFVALYFLTYTQANVLLQTYMFRDDGLFYGLAKQIASGHWLGKRYFSLTLAVVPSYAIFLAFSMVSRIPYLWLLSACNIAAVFFLLRKSSYLFDRARLLSLVLGVILLFNPIVSSFLRIYRFQFPAICFIVFTASLAALFNPDDEKQHWIVEAADACTAFLAWGFLWFSREENILYIGCLSLALLAFFAIRRSLARPWRNLRFVLYGLAGVLVLWLVICTLNKKYYGRFIVCEKTSAPYTEVIKTFHRIADPDYPQDAAGSGASVQKIRKIAQEVPLFQPLAEQILADPHHWGKLPVVFIPRDGKIIPNPAPVPSAASYFDRKSLDFVPLPSTVLPLTISHFEWAWSDGMEAAGYYDKGAVSLAEYYSSLDRELNKAIQEGRLAVRKDILIHAGPFFLAKKDVLVVMRLLWKYYPYFFPSPRDTAMQYQNILAQISQYAAPKEPLRGELSHLLQVKSIRPEETERHDKELHSFANRFWNKVTVIFSYTAVPLMHLATPAALLAFIVSLFRRRWAAAAVVAAISSIHIAYCLMLTAATVASGFYAANIHYFLSAYAPMIFTSFLSISILLRLNKAEAGNASSLPADS
jgi:hypothetical protein